MITKEMARVAAENRALTEKVTADVVRRLRGTELIREARIASHVPYPSPDDADVILRRVEEAARDLWRIAKHHRSGAPEAIGTRIDEQTFVTTVRVDREALIERLTCALDRVGAAIRDLGYAPMSEASDRVGRVTLAQVAEAAHELWVTAKARSYLVTLARRHADDEISAAQFTDRAGRFRAALIDRLRTNYAVVARLIRGLET